MTLPIGAGTVLDVYKKSTGKDGGTHSISFVSITILLHSLLERVVTSSLSLQRSEHVILSATGS